MPSSLLFLVLVVHWLAVGQAGVQFSARRPIEVHHAELTSSDKENKKNSAIEDR
jgi:hypothetical protein